MCITSASLWPPPPQPLLSSRTGQPASQRNFDLRMFKMALKAASAAPPLLAYAFTNADSERITAIAIIGNVTIGHVYLNCEILCQDLGRD